MKDPNKYYIYFSIDDNIPDTEPDPESMNMEPFESSTEEEAITCMIELLDTRCPEIPLIVWQIEGPGGFCIKREKIENIYREKTGFELPEL